VLKKQIINFIIVGIVNTIFGYSIYALFIYFGFNYIISIFIATIVGVLFNFKTIGKFVFNSKNNNLLFKFLFVYLIVFIINILVIKFFKIYGFNNYLAGLFALLPASVSSFILNKYFVFKGEKIETH